MKANSNTNLHDVQDVTVKKAKKPKHSEKCQDIVIETAKSKHEIRMFGEFEVEVE